MTRASQTSEGLAHLLGLTVRIGELTGCVWSPAPLRLENDFARWERHGRPASRREVVWACMSDRRVHLVLLDVATGDVLASRRTEHASFDPAKSTSTT